MEPFASRSPVGTRSSALPWIPMDFGGRTRRSREPLHIRVWAEDSGPDPLGRRRGRDLNPRSALRRITVFEIGSKSTICREFPCRSPARSPAGPNPAVSRFRSRVPRHWLLLRTRAIGRSRLPFSREAGLSRPDAREGVAASAARRERATAVRRGRRASRVRRSPRAARCRCPRGRRRAGRARRRGG